MATADWENILEDLFLRLLDCLDLKERVRGIVVVCKRWSKLCLANPPKHVEMAIELQNTTDPSYLPWLAKSLRHTAKLAITIHDPVPSDPDYPDLPQNSLRCLLARLANGSPPLKSLAISSPPTRQLDDFPMDPHNERQGYVWDHWAGNLHLLSQLEHLELDVEFIPIGVADALFYVFRDPPRDYFRGLALQSLNLKVIERGHYQLRHTEALENALLALTRLTRLKLEYEWDPNIASFGGIFGATYDWGDFAKAVAQLIELRSLDLKGSVGILYLMPEMSKLSNLSALGISGSIEDYGPIGTLLNLQELNLNFDGCNCILDIPFPAYSLFDSGALTRLTRLEINSCDVIGQDELPSFLPEAALRRLQGLVHLKLRIMQIDGDSLCMNSLVMPLARAAPHLSHLDLGGNDFVSIPPAIAGLERLHYLDLSENALQLGESCLEVVRSLPQLRSLNMRQVGKRVWSFESMGWIDSACILFPYLNVQI